MLVPLVLAGPLVGAVLLVLALVVPFDGVALVEEVEVVACVVVAGVEDGFSVPVLVSCLVLSAPDDDDCAPGVAVSIPFCAINVPLISSAECARAGTEVKTLNSKDA
jgi:hypothetical protein